MSLEDENQTTEYILLRHIFTEAVKSSVTDKRWQIYATYTGPKQIIITEYVHEASGDRIRCESYNYDRVTHYKYKCHLFIFTVNDKLRCKARNL